MLEVEKVDDGAVRIIRFNRPEARNAFNRALYDAVAQALTEAGEVSACHVAVLTGNGSAFSAGQDLKEMAQIVTGEASPDAAKGFRGLLDAVQGFEKPLIAAVNGVGVGLGFTLLAHCDLVFMADDARLRVPFAELGVPPEAASSYMFPRTFGWQRAARLLFTGEWMSAHEAVDSGLALAHFPADALVQETLAVARPSRHATRRRHGQQAPATGEPESRGLRGAGARGRGVRRVAGVGCQPGCAGAIRHRSRLLNSEGEGHQGPDRMTGRRWIDRCAGSGRRSALVAELDRAPDYGSGGWGFESLQACRVNGGPRAHRMPFRGVGFRRRHRDVASSWPSGPPRRRPGLRPDHPRTHPWADHSGPALRHWAYDNHRLPHGLSTHRPGDPPDPGAQGDRACSAFPLSPRSSWPPSSSTHPHRWQQPRLIVGFATAGAALKPGRGW